MISIPVAAAGQPVLKHELEQLNGVTSVAAMSTIPGKDATGHTRVRPAPGAEPIRVDYYFADASIFVHLQPVITGWRQLSPATVQQVEK